MSDHALFLLSLAPISWAAFAWAQWSSKLLKGVSG